MTSNMLINPRYLLSVVVLGLLVGVLTMSACSNKAN